MAGIPPQLLNELRQALVLCEQFESDRELKTIFTNEQLCAWRFSLRQADSLASRVDNLISLLVDKYRSGTRENALVLFVRLLSEQINEADERHHKLADLASELEKAIFNIHRFIPESPTSKTAFSLNSTLFKLIPFDIGTIWGLERGSFIGIISGFEGDGVYENLLNVEFALSEAIEASKASISLPKRQWVKIDPNKYSSVPKNEAQVLEAAINLTEELIQNSKDRHLPESSIPGIFFNIISKQFNNETSEQIRKWCNALCNQIYLSQPVAIVIHVISEVDENVNQIIQDIEINLKNIIEDKIPIDLMSLKRPSSNFNIIANQENKTDNPFLATTTKKIGLSVCSWIEYIAQNSPKMGDLEKEQYKDIVALYKSIKDNFSEKELETYYEQVSAVDVVDDILNFFSGAYSSVLTSFENIYPLFLKFIIEYFPQRSYELVEAYASKSSTVSQEANRKTLIIIANSGLVSDLLFDAWVHGSNYDTNIYENGLLFVDEKYTKNALLESLILAFLRGYQSSSATGNESLKVEENIKKWEIYLTPDLKILYKLLYLKEIKEEDFLSKYGGANQFTLAIRAKFKFERVLNKFKKSGINKPSLCWLLAGMAPSRDSFIELLKLDKKKRAVFGLCTPEEWQQIQRDEGNARQILDCRRKRQLIYPH